MTVEEQEKHPVALAATECYRCGEPIEEGEAHCPQCGRRLYRVCYCGWRIPVNAETCPQCQADWSGAMRVRRKSHSRQLNARRLGAFAVSGACAALALAGLTLFLLNNLAGRALSPGATMPEGFGDRLPLAWQGGADLLAVVGDRLARMGGGLAIVVVILVVGAVVGALVYLTREDLLHLGRPQRGGKASRVRRRRAR